MKTELFTLLTTKFARALFAMMLAGASVTTVWAQGQLPSGTLSSSGSGPSYTSTLSLVAGDRVDFAVGFGSNRNYIFDSTGLDATLTLHTAAVPEPGSLTLLGAAAATLTSWRLRRRLAAVSP